MDLPPYNNVFTPGEHLILELTCDDIFEGDVVYGAPNRIDLTNVRQHNNPNDILSGTYSFYRSDIQEIYKFRCENNYNSSNVVKMIKLSRNEYERLKRLIKNVTYLINVDKRFNDAVEILSRAENVGVVSLNVENGKNSYLNLLIMCNWQHVYIFDSIHLLNNELNPKLANILENEYICKVIHKAAPLTAILCSKYKVYAQNVFDTQIADLIIQKTSGVNLSKVVTKSLAECLNCYLNMPICLLKDASNLTRAMWQERPFTSNQKLYAAQLVTFLIPLKRKMERDLFSDVFNSSDNFFKHYHKLDDLQFVEICSSLKISKDVQDLIPNLIKNKKCNDKK